jgi:hypothetical protein
MPNNKTEEDGMSNYPCANVIINVNYARKSWKDPRENQMSTSVANGNALTASNIKWVNTCAIRENLPKISKPFLENPFFMISNALRTKS